MFEGSETKTFEKSLWSFHYFLQSIEQQNQFKLILLQASAISSAFFGASFEDFGISFLWITLQVHGNIADILKILCSLIFKIVSQIFLGDIQVAKIY